MNNSILIIDIETDHSDDWEQFRPEFTAPANYKDQAKIDASIQEQSKAWEDKLALSALTGRVLVIGVKSPDNKPTYYEGDEKLMLREFWDSVNSHIHHKYPVCGWNIIGFDLSFLIRRSWKYKLRIPDLFRGRYYDSNIVDLMQVWQAGNFKESYVSLDMAAKFFGLPGKSGNGKDFAALYKSDKSAALKYLEQDLTLTEQIGNCMGYGRSK